MHSTNMNFDYLFLCNFFLTLFALPAGYGKLPDYELLITDYLVDLARSKGKKLGLGGPDLDFEECPSAS